MKIVLKATAMAALTALAACEADQKLTNQIEAQAENALGGLGGRAQELTNKAEAAVDDAANTLENQAKALEDAATNEQAPANQAQAENATGGAEKKE
jgi:hypothetical protein